MDRKLSRPFDWMSFRGCGLPQPLPPKMFNTSSTSSGILARHPPLERSESLVEWNNFFLAYQLMNQTMVYLMVSDLV
jgi:hypothetical protein